MMKTVDTKTFWTLLGMRAIGAAVVTATGPEGPAGFLGLSVTCQMVRRVTELGSPSMRVAIGSLGAIGLVLWFAVVHAVRTGGDPAGALGSALVPALATGLSTGLCGLALQGVLVRLPGLTPLRERQW